MIDRESESVSKQRRKEGREGGKKEGRKEGRDQSKFGEQNDGGLKGKEENTFT